MSSRGVIGWIAAVAGSVLVMLYLVNLVRAGQFSVAGAVLGLAIGLLAIGTVAAIGAARVRPLRRRYPRAFVSNVAMYPQLHLQLHEISDALGVNSSNLRSQRAGAVVLDDVSLSIFAGLPLRQILALPSTAIASIGVAKAPQGKWVLSSLEARFSSQAGELPADFCVMNSNFGYPHAVGRAELERQLARARAALGKSIDS